MRLWHQNLISKLPRQQLLGQHRECCALRGLGWGKKHATVNYVFEYSYIMLFCYHVKIMEEMIRRGYKADYKWSVSTYRGKRCEPASYEFAFKNHNYADHRDYIYPEHNNNYLQECILNLEGKGVKILI